MYAPPAFRIDDEAAAFRHIAAHGFATLVTATADGASISHLPMLADPARRVLRGHLARANPHAHIIGGKRHIAAFVGANAYVSPDWYADPKQVPTWNYVVVHACGAGRVLDAEADVDALLDELSDAHERRRNDLADGRIWTLAKLPTESLRKMRAAIVAFEIAIETIELKAKLSQNKSAADIRAVAAKLATGDENARAVAAAMNAAAHPQGPR